MSIPKPDKDRLRSAATALAACNGVVKDAATALGVSRTTLSHWIHSGWLEEGATHPPADVPITQKERTRLEDEIRRLKQELRNAHRESIEADDIRSFAFKLGQSSIPKHDWLVRPSDVIGTPGVPVTIWSDWHHGEIVNPEEMDGLNEFNIDISKKRVGKLVERTLDLLFQHTVKPDYPGIVVGLLGDMFSGGIHPELAESNEAEILAVLLDLLSVLEWALDEIAKNFDSVIVPCVVGNHDRMYKDIRFKARAATSYSWLLYCLLEKRFKERGDSKVQFKVSPHTDVLLDVQGKTHCFTHGDSIGAYGGSGVIGPLGPIIRGAMKTADQYAQLGQNVDVVAMGHYHQRVAWAHRGIVVNSALKGWDEYAKLNRFRPEPPSQNIWFVHPKHGFTFEFPVFVSDEGGRMPRMT